MNNEPERIYMNLENLISTDSDNIINVADGRKPGALINQEYVEDAISKNLQVIEGDNNHSYISRNLVVESYFTLDDLTQWFNDLDPRFSARIHEVYEPIKDKTVAEALSALSQHTREQHEMPSIAEPEHNLERPEVAALDGVLFGYPVQEIKRYLTEWYTFDEQLVEEFAVIKEAERRYSILDDMRIDHAQSESEHPLSLVQVSPEYKILHHPYSDLVNALGQTLQMTALEPERLKSMSTWGEWRLATAEILEEGGSLVFDRRNDVNWIGMINSCVPEDSTLKVSDRAWEVRLLQHVDEVLPAIKAALELPDDYPAVGMVHQDLQDLGAFAQAYKIGKTQGLDYLKTVAPQLGQGEFLLK